MITSVQPGDVLLMTCDENLFIRTLCKCIGALDNFAPGKPHVCHASIVDRNMTVASMDPTGLQVLTLDEVKKRSINCWAYRVKGDFDLAKVLAKIDQYKNAAPAYAYADYVLLPFIVMARKIAINTLPLGFRTELRMMLDRCSTKIVNLIKLRKDALICSELAYRCITEAGVPLEIPDTRLSTVLHYGRGKSGLTYHADQLEKLVEHLAGIRGLVAPEPNWITPGDLISSPSLELVTQVK